MAVSEVAGQRHPAGSTGSASWSWLLVFVGLSVLLVGGMLAWWAVFGFWDTLFDPSQPFGISFDGRNHLTMAVLLAFVAAGTGWVRRGVLRDVERLGELAGATRDEIDQTLRHNASPPTAVRGAAFAAALVLAVVIIPLTGGRDISLSTGWDMHHVWAVATNLCIFFLMIEGAWLSIQNLRTLHRYLTSRLPIDLLDRGALASIGRMGLRGAVLWLVGGTIASTLTWGMNQAAPVLVILTLLLGFATASMLLPALMARGRLREAKAVELRKVRRRIARAREAMWADGPADRTEQSALMTGLLAYEARIESVREWPFDTPTLLRFALLAVLAAGSWLGGALVERALGVVLD